MTAAMEFEAKPTRHECFSAKSMVRPKQLSDMGPFIVGQICGARSFSPFGYCVV